MKPFLLTLALLLALVGPALAATTVTIGDNTGNTYSGTDDAHIRSDSTTTNYGTNGSLEVTKYAVGNHVSALVKFSGLSNIVGPVTVSSATLYLYYTGPTSGSDTHTIDVHRVLRAWVEAQATWNIYSTGNSWTTAGALSDGNDRVATVSASFALIGNTSPSYVAYTGAQLATDVENIINGSNANNGWVFERSDAGDDTNYRIFASSEGSDGQRPYLDITYTVAGTTVRHRVNNQ